MPKVPGSSKNLQAHPIQPDGYVRPAATLPQSVPAVDPSFLPDQRQDGADPAPAAGPQPLDASPVQPDQQGPAPAPLPDQDRQVPAHPPLMVDSSLDLPDKPPALQQTYQMASQGDPDHVAKVLGIAQKTGEDPAFIDKNLPQVVKAQSQPAVSFFKELEDKYPGTTKYLSAPANMAVAHDDIPNLAQHEALVQQAHEVHGLYDAFKSGAENSVLGLAYRGQLPDLALPENASILQSLASQAGSLLFDLPVMAVGGALGAPAGAAVGATIGAAGGLPGIGVGGTIGAAGGASAGAFAFPAALRTMLVQHYQKGDLKDFNDFLSRSGEVIKEASKQGLVGLATAGAGGLASKTIGGTVAPLAAEVAAMTTAGKAVEGETPTARDFLEGALLVGAMHGSTELGKRYLEAKKTIKAQEFYTAMGATAEASKLRMRLPEQQQQFIADITKDGPVENVYVDPQRISEYFQSKKIDPDQAMAAIGATKAFEEAKATGVDVKIPLATWVNKLVGSPHYQGLAEDIKFSPDDYSVRQIKERTQQARDQMKAIADQQAQDAEAAKKEQTQAKLTQVGQTIQDQLKAAGLSKPEQQFNPQLIEEFLTTMGQPFGMSAEQMLEKFPLTIQKSEAPTPAEGQVLHQGAAAELGNTQDAPAFYSRLQKTVEQKLPNKATPEQVRGIVRDLNKEEIKYSGLENYLNGKDKIDKQELLNFLQENQIQIQDVTKGGQRPDAPPGADIVPGPNDTWAIKYYGGGSEGGFATRELAELALQRAAEDLNAPDTKFDQYTLPGGENYREVLFTLPQKPLTDLPEGHTFQDNTGKPNAVKYPEQTWFVKNEKGEVAGMGATKEAALADLQKISMKGDTFKSSHFDESNILAHVRLNDRTDADGKKVLFVEEVQSDWHQAGRKKGYKGPEADQRLSELKAQIEELKKESYKLNPSSSEWEQKVAEINKLRDEVDNLKDTKARGVPDAPFKKNWHEFALKKILRMAAEGGYDRVAWTTGDQQAARYDLSKDISHIQYDTGSDLKPGQYGVKVYDKSENVLKSGVYNEIQLEDLIGKELTKKIVAGEGKPAEGLGSSNVKIISGDNLKVGGEGMKGFYDKIVPDFLNKYTKKWDGKVGETRITTAEHANLEIEHDGDGYRVMKGNEDVGGGRFETEDEAKEFMSAYGGITHAPVHSLDITPKMRDSLLHEGQSLFQGDSAETARGRIRISPMGAAIDLFKNRDKSTFLHESGHYFLDVLGKLAQEENAPQQIKDDYQTLLKWMGVEKHEDIGVEHHEKFARGFEAYLREGKAPSLKLQRAFDRFKQWLTGIYKRALDLKVDLTDDVRAVMNRMLATETEISYAQDVIGAREDMIPGVSPEMSSKISDLQRQARDVAERTLMKEQMAELSKERQKFLNSERERLTAESEEKVSQMPLFAAKAELESQLGKKDATARASRFLKALEKGQGADAEFDAVAELHGFASGEDLARQIVDASKSDLFRNLVKDRVAQAMVPHADLMSSDAIQKAALKAVHNEKRTELLALEREALSGLIVKDLMNREISKRRRIDARLEAQAAQTQAREILSTKNLKDATNFKPYVTAERQAAVRAAQELAKARASEGKQAEEHYAKASEEKRKQLLNHALVAEAMRNGEERDSAIAFLKPFIARGMDLKEMPYGFMRQIDQMLSRFGLAPDRGEDVKTLSQMAQDLAAKGTDPLEIANQTGMTLNDAGQYVPESVRQFVDRVNDNYYAVSLPDSILNAADRKPGDLSLSELRDLRDSVKFISSVGKKFDRFLSDFIKSDMKTAAAEFRKSIEENVGQPYGGLAEIGFKHDSKLKETVDSILKLPDTVAPELVNVLTLAQYLDGNRPDGPAKQYIYRVMKAADDRKILRVEKMHQEMNAILERHYTPKELSEYKSKRERFEGVKNPMTREQILSMALNWGNEGNRDRIRKGYNLDDAQVARLLDHLDKRDWDFVQATWDHLGSYWPEIQALEMKARGVEAKKVEISPVHTKFGTYDGGYYPIAYDPEKSSFGYVKAEERNALYKQYSATAAHTDRGHTEARAATFGKPVDLSLRVLFNHLENVAHDLEYRTAVIDVNRFLKQTDVRTALENAIGIPGYRSIENWLKAVASDQGEFLGPGEKAIRWCRFGATYSVLALRIPTFPIDVTGNFAIAGSEIGFGNMLRASKDFLMSPHDTKEFVDSKSPRMARRAKTRDRDLQDLTKKWEGKESYLSQYGFFLQSAADELIAYPVWMHTYKSMLAEHGDAKAASIADETITRTLGSGSILDQVGAQRGNEWKKATSMFYSFMSMMFNRMWLSGKVAGLEYRKENYGKAIAIMAQATVYGWLLQSANENFWRELYRNNTNAGGGNDDDRMKRIVSRTLQQPFGYVWLLRDISQPLLNKAAGIQGAGSNVAFSPLESALETVTKPIADVGEVGLQSLGVISGHKELDHKFAEDTAKSASMMLGYPQQLNSMAFNLMDWIENNGELTWRDALARRTKK